MKPADGTYRLSSPGAPSMDIVVTGMTATSTLDTFDYLPGPDVLRARNLSLVIECTGAGTFTAFVGVQPGFVVAGSCIKTA